MTLLRPATAADIPELLALWAVAAENDARPSDSPQAVEALLERDPEACIVAEADGQIVGSLIAGWDGWRASLYRLAVHPAARRRGITTRLLRAAEDRLVELGATRIGAMVLESNVLGQSVWRAAGYTRQDEWRRWVLPIGDGRR